MLEDASAAICRIVQKYSKPADDSDTALIADEIRPGSNRNADQQLKLAPICIECSREGRLERSRRLFESYTRRSFPPSQNFLRCSSEVGKSINGNPTPGTSFTTV